MAFVGVQGRCLLPLSHVSHKIEVSQSLTLSLHSSFSVQTQHVDARGSLRRQNIRAQQPRPIRRNHDGSKVSASAIAAVPVPPAPPENTDASSASPFTTHSWMWQGHRINYAVAGCGKPLLFVHGFGASVGHWRKTAAVLSKDYKCYAIDLLGQGASEKPITNYTMELWAEQVEAFAAEFIDQPFVLIGNSVGSLACLMVNAALPAERVAGTVLVNCAGGLNNKALTADWRIRLALPLFWLIDFLLSQPRVARWLFDKFRSRDNLRKVLLNVYSDPAAVDDALVEMLYGPSDHVGALEAFVSIITGPPGPPPQQLMPSVSGPLLCMWGDADVFTPLDGPVGNYFQALPESRPNTEFRKLTGANHCIHDDDPSTVNSIISDWLQQQH